MEYIYKSNRIVSPSISFDFKLLFIDVSFICIQRLYNVITICQKDYPVKYGSLQESDA